MFTRIHPESLGAAKGFSHGLLAPAGGRILFVAGQVGWDEQGQFSFVEQFAKALGNALEVVRAAGGGATNIGRMTLYVTDKAEYISAQKEIGQAYRQLMGKHFPAMALLEVKGLLDPLAKVEIEVTAVI